MDDGLGAEVVFGVEGDGSCSGLRGRVAEEGSGDGGGGRDGRVAGGDGVDVSVLKALVSRVGRC